MTSGLINYHEFIENMDKIFTQKDTDKHPMHTVYQINRETTLPARRQYQVNIYIILKTLTEDEEKELDEVI